MRVCERRRANPRRASASSRRQGSAMRIEPGNDLRPHPSMGSPSHQNADMLQAHTGLASVFDDPGVAACHHVEEGLHGSLGSYLICHIHDGKRRNGQTRGTDALTIEFQNASRKAIFAIERTGSIACWADKNSA